MSQSPYYNKSEILNRGWTTTAITKFLGEPDKRGKNRRRRKGTVLLYLKNRVHQAEETPAFKQWKEKSETRRQAALRAAEKNRQQTLDHVSRRLDSIQLKEEFIGLTRDELRTRAVNSFLELEALREQRSGSRYKAQKVTSRRSPEFFDRIETNYLRHEGTVYDSELGVYFNKTGVGQAVDMVRERVYELISAAYPHLQHECDRQLNKRREKATRTRGYDVTSRSAKLERP